MALNMKVKPQHLAQVAVEVIKQRVVVPGLINRGTLDDFKGRADDTITTRVPGYLPAHEIENWRAERTDPLQLDAYNERKVTLTLGGNSYSATKLQDEQKDFDLMQWSEVVAVQAEALARNMEDKALNLMLPYDPVDNPGGTPYMITVGGAVSSRSSGGMRADLAFLRKVANKALMPREGRIFVFGPGIEEAILTDEKIVLSMNTSEATAEGALREARIGRIMGFDMISVPDLPDDFGCLFVRDAFVLRTAVPSVPDSVPFGATASADGYGVRWMRDYDSGILSERSILNHYNAVQYVTDVLFDKENLRVASETPTSAPYEYVIRAIAFDLSASSDSLPVGVVEGDKNDTFARITGVGTRAE